MSKTDKNTPLILNPKPVKKGDHVFLIDGSGYIFRAYHALPPLTRASDQLPVGAVHGFCQMLWKLLRDMDDMKPSHLAVIFDTKKNYRNDIYPAYKANRPPAPEDLVPQFPLIRDAVRAFNVPCLELEGYEADDLIATYTRQSVEAGGDVTIVSSDKDLMQLVQPGVVMLDTMKNKRFEAEQVFEKFGVGPEKVIDVQSLAGDSVDNVPGVPGIGIKTAALLINEYGDLDTLLGRASEIKQNKRRENLITFADQARISRDLVTLRQDVPVIEALDQFALRDPEPKTLLDFLSDMEFNTLTKRIADSFDCKVPVKKISKSAAPEMPDDDFDDTPQGLATFRAAKMRALPVQLEKYQTITKRDDLKRWIEDITKAGFVTIDTETTSLDTMTADLVGISLSVEPGTACYIPLAHKGGEGLDLEGGNLIEQLPMDEVLTALKPLLESPAILKVGQNLKYDQKIFKALDIDLTPIDDTMLMSYALDAGRSRHGMDHLAKVHLDHTCIPFKEVAGSGKKAITFDFVPLDQATPYAAEDADITNRLWQLLKPRLAAENMTTVYETLERPLVPVLVQMERNGILVDREILSRLSDDFAQKMAQYESDIYELAGGTFNIASPKQLGELLFDPEGMALSGGKKTKTGAYSTGAGVLESLAINDDVPPNAQRLVRTVLDWRALAKLKSTYTDALPTFINAKTKRIHTSYAMAGTSTGRLASSDPNLQNIPVRTKEGRLIRTAFIAAKGCKLVSADYSQVELRILAHMADIDQLKQAFLDGLDIHALTASEMFDVPLDEMTGEIRRRAKAINFGIIYGISAFGLANQLSISRGEASDYIKTYFKRFPGIRDYMEDTKEYAREHGYVQTLFGRRIHFPEMNAKGPRRAIAERAAINAPIQGSAADILRRAMIHMPDALSGANLKAKMLLQVHDELIFEVPEAEVEKTIKLVSKIMETACTPVLQLSVPLKVDAQAADNWDEAH
ncbi:MAG: DNA polymerase I [Hyphomicrobiaceae bacterium]|nr:DNA polymerase I [Hyphomicrobiaceae bacterium]